MHVWSVGDVAVKPHNGIVRIAEIRSSAGEMVAVLEAVSVFRSIANLPQVPLRAAGEHLVPLVEPGAAAEIVAMLRETSGRTAMPGDAAARLERCARALTYGNIERHRRALHALYCETHRPTADDLAVIEKLEAIVLGEIAEVRGQELDDLRADMRQAHARFADDAPALAEPASAGVVSAMLGTRAICSGDGTPQVTLSTRPGRWVLVPSEEPTWLVATHESELSRVDELLAQVEVVGLTSTDGGFCGVWDDACDDRAIDDELFDPIDGTLFGRGLWTGTGGDGPSAIGATRIGHEAVLLVVTDPA